MGKAARNKARTKTHQQGPPRRHRDITGRKVCVSYVNPGQVSAYFMQSMVGLLFREHLKAESGLPTALFADRDTTGKIVAAGGWLNKYSSANISNARNDIVRDFLAMPAQPDWLWMVDSDMHFEPDTLDKLLASADPDPESEHYAPIVGGLCFGTNDGKLFATLYGIKDVPGEGVRSYRYDEFPPDAMFQVAATGAACLLIHRTVLEQMRDKNFNAVYPWFQETELNGRPCGEDFTFCLRAGMLGFPVWVDTGIKIGHHKSHILTDDMYLEQRKQKKEAAVDG